MSDATESAWTNAAPWDGDGFDGIAALAEGAAWMEGFRRGLAFAQAERESAWPESWRKTAEIMRRPGGRLFMHEDDARRFVEAGGDVEKVCVSQMATRGVAYAFDTRHALAWVYDPLRVPEDRRHR